MKKNKKNEELQSRREFFKKAAKGALPILGAIALANTPLLAKATATEEAPMGCDYGCYASCYGDCDITCKETCRNLCKETCRGSCKNGCYSECHGTCKWTCSGGCDNSSSRY